MASLTWLWYKIKLCFWKIHNTLLSILPTMKLSVMYLHISESHQSHSQHCMSIILIQIIRWTWLLLGNSERQIKHSENRCIFIHLSSFSQQLSPYKEVNSGGKKEGNKDMSSPWRPWYNPLLVHVFYMNNPQRAQRIGTSHYLNTGFGTSKPGWYWNNRNN